MHIDMYVCTYTIFTICIVQGQLQRKNTPHNIKQGDSFIFAWYYIRIILFAFFCMDLEIRIICHVHVETENLSLLTIYKSRRHSGEGKVAGLTSDGRYNVGEEVG